MIKLTASPEINYGANQLTVVGAFEQDGRLYDIVVDAEGDLLKKGGQLPDLARRIQGAWKSAYQGLAPMRRVRAEQVVFSYSSKRKIVKVITPTHRFGTSSRFAREAMRALYRDLGARVIQTRLAEPPAAAALPSRGMQAFQACIKPLFAKHASDKNHLFHGHKLEDVKKCPKAQAAIQQAILGPKPNKHFAQMEQFIDEIQELFQVQAVPGAQEARCEELAQKVFDDLFLSKETQALFEAESRRLGEED